MSNDKIKITKDQIMSTIKVSINVGMQHMLNGMIKVIEKMVEEKGTSISYVDLLCVFEEMERQAKTGREIKSLGININKVNEKDGFIEVEFFNKGDEK